MTLAVYPGSFDPFTNGHLNVVQRARGVADEVIVAVAANTLKKGRFTVEQRIELVAASITDLTGVKVVAIDGLVAEYARQCNASFLLKAVRNSTDFDHEVMQATANKTITGIETVVLLSDPAYAHISSTLVTDIARHGGDITQMVPPAVAAAFLASIN